MKNIIAKQLSKREKVIVLLTLGLGGGSLIYIFLIEPFLANINDMNNEILIKETKLQKIYALIGHKDKIEAEYEKFLKASSSNASDEAIISDILKQVEKIAVASSVQLNNVRPERLRNEEVKRLRVEITAEAGVSSMLKFIYDLEMSPFLITVERLQIVPSRTQPGYIETTLLISKLSFT